MHIIPRYSQFLFIVLAVLILSSPLISFISFNSVDAQRQGQPPGSGGGPPPGSGGGPPPQPPATLIVYKQVINDNGGTAQASDFTFSVTFRGCDGSGSGTGQIQASAQGVQIQMNAQDTCGYQVHELVPETYTLTAMSGECQRSAITPSATYTCTIVNNDNPNTGPPATLQIFKQVINDNGGTAQASDFTFRLFFTHCDGSTSGAGPIQFSEGGLTYSLPSSSICGYRVLEASSGGYESTKTGECEVGSTTPGATYTCRVINDDIPTG